MRSRYGNKPLQRERPFPIQMLGHNLPILLFLILAVAGMGAVYWFFSPVDSSSSAAEALAINDLDGGLSAPIYKTVPDKPVLQRLAQSPGPLRVGIIVGHRNNDSGAVCDDGLTELDVNSDIAQQVYAQLLAKGIHTDLLDEFDPLMQDYYATALISIHADSCDYINDLATGFKVAGSSYTNSSQLSICVEQAYYDTTEMFYHENTITPHMTDYHAFREIAPGVPAIIIETGFLNLDRDMLTTESYKPANGITNGILCFLGRS
ncbi:MAG: N-acetylmuramoyl-L-alanine amidase [Ardenticatenaceae bacterium]|nr:N-acetylmuramoyl-L-alanine amidase [Anaerolineales bacterium]MCB8921999.1 N-acetylmuramoyl-L-alanine amidase [Ardenticatenaceae bacterium]MCB8989575.1 N-acetylmuramoyl-L-alanine amidase [Ardenticatenaceae bacterium]MCB9003118.1 N-acetylmuramoyl-L-alanine amidase [Ardenticatenaceae bacterium]